MSQLELLITAMEETITAANLIASRKVQVMRHAGKYTWEELSKKKFNCPAIFLSCLGWRESTATEEADAIGISFGNDDLNTVRFVAGVVTKATSTEARNIEAQYISEQLSKLLNGQVWGKSNVAEPMQIKAEGLFIPKAEINGLSMWLISWAQVVGFTPYDTDTKLADFLRYYAQHVNAEGDVLQDDYIEFDPQAPDGAITTESGAVRITADGFYRVGE